jgi:hypothetical protein
VNSLDSLYAGALRQFPTGRIGWSGLCKPLLEGVEGFMLMYFRLLSCGIWVLLSLIVFLTLVWNAFVGSLVFVWKFSVFWFRIAVWGV